MPSGMKASPMGADSSSTVVAEWSCSSDMGSV